MAGSPATPEQRLDVTPVWPVRLRGETFSAPARREGDVRVRLVHVGDEPVVLRVAQPADDRVVIGARSASEDAGRAALARARIWTAVDDDLAPFVERFAGDPLIGAGVRAEPWRRPFRRATTFEALALAVCEQLIDDERARAINGEILRRLGRRHAGLTDLPSADTVAGLSPAELERCGLAHARAVALIRAAREVASGRVDLDDPERHVHDWRRLRAINGIGAWTLSMLALHGQGVPDALPAGDFAYRNLVGQVRSGLPQGMASEQDVVEFLAPYAGWRGVAGWHLLMLGPSHLRAALGLGPMREHAREQRHRTR